MVISQNSYADGEVTEEQCRWQHCILHSVSQHRSNFAELTSGRDTEGGVLVLWHENNNRAMRSWVSQFSCAETVTYIRVTRNSTFFYWLWQASHIVNFFLHLYLC